MTVHEYSEHEDLRVALDTGDPMLAVISFDDSEAWYGHIDECLEHHILLAKAGLPSTDIDRFFRIVFDREGADWTFVCPPGYGGIKDKSRRIEAFYRDGFAAISAFLTQTGAAADIRIPARYRRHADEPRNTD